MVAFSIQTLLNSGPASYMTGITDLDIRMSDDGLVLYATSGPTGGITSYRLAPGGAEFLDRDAFLPGQDQASLGQVEEITINGQSLLVALGRHQSAPQCFDLAATGELVGTGQLTAQGGFPAAIVSMEMVTLGARDFIYVSHFGIDGVSVYEPDGTGQLVQTGHVGTGTSMLQSADLVAMHSVQMGAQTYLLTLSVLDNALTCYQLDPDGIPVQTDRLDAETGLSIAGATAIAPAVVGGQQYLVVAAANSSSLSVLRLDPDGTLTATDHVIDDLNTRFQGATALEAVTVGDRVYLVAGGGDDGLSLFTLLPGGRLLHLTQIADNVATGLTNITALALYEQDGIIQIFASGEGEAGITHLSVDPGPIGQTFLADAAGGTIIATAGGDVLVGAAGNDNLRGGAGDDILVDGAGYDNLRGGAGADVFVFTADGLRDTVADFEFGIDRLDLSGLGRIYNLSQLTITSTSWGAKIRFGDEEIRLYSIDNMPLNPAAFRIGDLVDLAHYPIARAEPDGPIIGGEGSDWLNGSAQNDVMDGRGGDDVLVGGNGDDDLTLGAGNDLGQGGAGNDSLFGNAGADTLEGGDGNDLLKGGTEDDLLSGEAGRDRLYGGGGRDRLYGGDGDDRVYGGKDRDIIHGDAGNDDLYGEGGGDTLFGGEGDDTVYGGGGRDVLNGDAGNDTLYGEADHDTLRGDAGDDVLYGGQGSDQLYGGNGGDLVYTGGGNDKAFGGKGQDTLRGEDGNDTLSGEDGYDTLRGDAGDDKLYGGARGDRLIGGDGRDTLYGEDGSDKLYGGAGSDILSGADGMDTLSGDEGNDTLFGGLGRDRLFGGTGSDLIYSGADNDKAYGGDGGDVLRGEDGDDVLYGDAGHDTLRGDADNDRLYGGTGKDRLIGGAGNDTLTGDENTDTFVFADGFGEDLITDFAALNDAERIDLAGVSAITDFADLLAHHMSQTGADVLIDDGAGNTITLLGVSLGDLQAADFLF